jgi:hypothetical protein
MRLLEIALMIFGGRGRKARSAWMMFDIFRVLRDLFRQ